MEHDDFPQEELTKRILRCAYETHRILGPGRADLIVNDSVLIELKAVERLLPIHHVQTLTYLRHSRLPVALLINFNVPRLKFGLHRFVRSRFARP